MIGWRSKPQTSADEGPKGFDDFDIRLGDLMRGERATLGKSLLDVQRELKIKATYIAAIENADLSVFDTPGFVAGYVRSYSRYLGLDPEETFARFCAEANFVPSNSMSSGAAAGRGQIVKASASKPGRDYADPFANPNPTFIPRGESAFSRIQLSALGSVAVLAALLGALGYGGWSILQEVQRVQLAPVDQAPAVVVSIDPLPKSETIDPLVASQAQASAALVEHLYRPQALDVPVMVSRNGPISAIDPRLDTSETTALAQVDMGPHLQDSEVQVTQAPVAGVEVLAVRPAWVRVSAADGTVLFEKILNSGERYSVPQNLTDPASIRAGNSGAVYFVVDGQTYGPASAGSKVVKGIALTAENLTEKFAAADVNKDRDLERVMTAEVQPSAQ